MEKIYSYMLKKLTVSEAVEIQRILKKQIKTIDDYKKIEFVAGVDLSVLKDQKKLICGIVVFEYPELREIERKWSVVDETFPYIPGLLAFREAPAIIETFNKLQNKPDLLMVDGHGIAHPRGIGIASHVGVILDIPSIGVAKKKLYGNYDLPEEQKGSLTGLVSRNGEIIGFVLRTRDSVKPVFVSIGHRISLKSSVEIVLGCSGGYRLPEPTRIADKYVKELKKSIV